MKISELIGKCLHYMTSYGDIPVIITVFVKDDDNQESLKMVTLNVFWKNLNL